MYTLRDLQLSELSILKAFKKICQNNHLKFYLDSGTLLGAVRHQGFIPWDDDIDVVMPKEDYLKLLKLPSDVWSPDLFLQSKDTDPEYFMDFIKIRKNHTHCEEPTTLTSNIHKGHWIDVFPLVDCPKYEKFAPLSAKINLMLTVVGQSKLQKDLSVIGYEKKGVLLCTKLLRFLPLKTIQLLRTVFVDIFSKPTDKRLYSIKYPSKFICSKEFLKSNWLDSEIELEFEGEFFPVPKNYHEVLTVIYGDYMVLPPENERKAHCISYSEF